MGRQVMLSEKTWRDLEIVRRWKKAPSWSATVEFLAGFYLDKVRSPEEALALDVTEMCERLKRAGISALLIESIQGDLFEGLQDMRKDRLAAEAKRLLTREGIECQRQKETPKLRHPSA